MADNIIIEDDDVTCYITNDEEIAIAGEKPHVVCTSEPEEVRMTMRHTEISFYFGMGRTIFEMILANSNIQRSRVLSEQSTPGSTVSMPWQCARPRMLSRALRTVLWENR